MKFYDLIFAIEMIIISSVRQNIGFSTMALFFHFTILEGHDIKVIKTCRFGPCCKCDGPKKWGWEEGRNVGKSAEW